jgi:hypothetical protein
MSHQVNHPSIQALVNFGFREKPTSDAARLPYAERTTIEPKHHFTPEYHGATLHAA